MTTLPLIHPKRPTVGYFRPFKAMKHFKKLIADKEDTEQVFHILKALSSKKHVTRADNFWKSKHGQELLASKLNLIKILDNHEELRKLPMGSLAHAYCDFMESEGLTAQGLADEYDSFAQKAGSYDDLLELYSDRLRDTHDLFHVLTGYGRDALGEQALLAFSNSQNPNLGTFFIAYAGGYEMKKTLQLDLPVYAAIREGGRHGKMAKKIAHQDILELLPLPLEEVRTRLNIKPPITYQQAHQIMHDGGVDPYDLLGEQQLAAQ